MTEKNMPAAEAEVASTPETETASYELAFHVLPTVAEGEVATVFQNLKDIITKHGGVLTTEEEPARFDLAYEVVKHLEGRNRKFNSAYFGWIRFSSEPSAIAEITEETEGVSELLRHLLIKLTRTEEANPFYFHEALDLLKQKSEVIEVDDEVSSSNPEESLESEEEVDKTDDVTTKEEDTASTEDKDKV